MIWRLRDREFSRTFLFDFQNPYFVAPHRTQRQVAARLTIAAGPGHPQASRVRAPRPPRRPTPLLLESIALRRCRRITVSGLTTVIAFRIEGKNRYSQRKISPSMFRRRIRHVGTDILRACAG